MMPSTQFRHLLSGFDTIECAYWLAPKGSCGFDFQSLAVKKGELAQAKKRRAKAITLGNEEFLLASHGTGSGFTFLLENDAFAIQCGEFNNPNFFVTFRSIALWHHGASALHQRFLNWADSVGMTPYRPEKLSRVDFTFDYQIDRIDFDEDSFVSRARKDAKFRTDRHVQTFNVATGDPFIRMYNKSAEIKEQSGKTWFHKLWGVDQNVWRIESETKKEQLKRFGIRTFNDLQERQGDACRYLFEEHTTLRIPTKDSNRSRWPLHRLWIDLQSRVRDLDALGVIAECDRLALLEERLMHYGISIYGYLKRIAAVHALQQGIATPTKDQAFERLGQLMNLLHDPLAWDNGVLQRMDEMRLGQ